MVSRWKTGAISFLIALAMVLVTASCSVEKQDKLLGVNISPTAASTIPVLAGSNPTLPALPGNTPTATFMPPLEADITITPAASVTSTLTSTLTATLTSTPAWTPGVIPAQPSATGQKVVPFNREKHETGNEEPCGCRP